MSFRAFSSSNSYSRNIGQMTDVSRQLALEQQVKTFNGSNGQPAVTIGKYADGKYGYMATDTSGVRRILLGQHPTTGDPGLWISKDGVDVIDELSA